MAGLQFVLSVHAATVIGERGIERAWLALALESPDRIEPDRFDVSIKHALVRIPQRGDRVLRVVYNPSETPHKVITAYFDRREMEKR